MALFSSHHSRHHHHRHNQYNVRNAPQRVSWRRDKKMIIGTVTIALACLIVALGPGKAFLNETFMLIKALLTPEPVEAPLEVDPLKINYKLRQKREAAADSIAALQHIDTMRREIRQQSVPVYRPPKKRDEWYLTEKDMQELRRGQESPTNE